MCNFAQAGNLKSWQERLAFARCALRVYRSAFIVHRSLFGVWHLRVRAFSAGWLFSFSYASVLFLLFFFSVSLCDFSVNLSRMPGMHV